MVEDLTDKQRVFVEHYLACWNAAEAARRAGYSADSARSIGSENLTKPDIRAAIARRLAELAMGADEVLARLSDLARGDIRALLRFDAEGNFDGLRLHQDAPLHLIKKLTPTKAGTTIELHDPAAALTRLGEHHGLFKSSGEAKPVEHVHMTLDEWKREAAARLAAAEATLAAGDAPTSDDA